MAASLAGDPADLPRRSRKLIDSTDHDGSIDIEAGEYVIGTLDAEQRAAFLARLRQDAAARQAVAAWERRLAGLAMQTDPVFPSPELYARIEQAIRSNSSKPVPFRVIEGGNRAGRGPGTVTDYRKSRDRWRVGALVGCAVAAVLGFVVVRPPPATSGSKPDSTTFIAAVNRGGDKPALIIRVDLKTRQVLVRPVAAQMPAGRSLELWYLDGTSAPRSMGVLIDAPSTLAMPQGATPSDGMTFAVSLEPMGGSKTGRPTGPVVYSGQLLED